MPPVGQDPTQQYGTMQADPNAPTAAPYQLAGAIGGAPTPTDQSSMHGQQQMINNPAYVEGKPILPFFGGFGPEANRSSARQPAAVPKASFRSLRGEKTDPT